VGDHAQLLSMTHSRHSGDTEALTNVLLAFLNAVERLRLRSDRSNTASRITRRGWHLRDSGGGRVPFNTLADTEPLTNLLLAHSI
jgi:hypothetical protein